MKSLITALLCFFALNVNAQVADKAENISPLLISESIPSVELYTAEGNAVQLLDELKGKKSLLIFYRGGWCPYCSAHLSDIGLVEKEILSLGYSIYGISPDSPEHLNKTREDIKINYSVFSDADTRFMQAMGIAFKGPEKYKDMFVQVSGNKNSEGVLPVPSIFIVDENGTIIFEYISPKYSERMSADLLLSVLKTL